MNPVAYIARCAECSYDQNMPEWHVYQRRAMPIEILSHVGAYENERVILVWRAVQREQQSCVLR